MLIGLVAGLRRFAVSSDTRRDRAGVEQTVALFFLSIRYEGLSVWIQ